MSRCALATDEDAKHASEEYNKQCKSFYRTYRGAGRTHPPGALTLVVDHSAFRASNTESSVWPKHTIERYAVRALNLRVTIVRSFDTLEDTENAPPPEDFGTIMLLQNYEDVPEALVWSIPVRYSKNESNPDELNLFDLVHMVRSGNDATKSYETPWGIVSYTVDATRRFYKIGVRFSNVLTERILRINAAFLYIAIRAVLFMMPRRYQHLTQTEHRESDGWVASALSRFKHKMHDDPTDRKTLTSLDRLMRAMNGVTYRQDAASLPMHFDELPTPEVLGHYGSISVIDFRWLLSRFTSYGRGFHESIGRYYAAGVNCGRLVASYNCERLGRVESQNVHEPSNCLFNRWIAPNTTHDLCLTRFNLFDQNSFVEVTCAPQQPVLAALFNAAPRHRQMLLGGSRPLIYDEHTGRIVGEDTLCHILEYKRSSRVPVTVKLHPEPSRLFRPLLHRVGQATYYVSDGDLILRVYYEGGEKSTVAPRISTVRSVLRSAYEFDLRNGIDASYYGTDGVFYYESERMSPVDLDTPLFLLCNDATSPQVILYVVRDEDVDEIPSIPIDDILTNEDWNLILDD